MFPLIPDVLNFRIGTKQTKIENKHQLPLDCEVWWVENTHLNPEMAFKSEDLPAPDGPIIALNCPFLKTPLTPCNKHFFFESVTAIKK